MILDGATVALQWATGGLAFLWLTTRRREVSLGYGWSSRVVFGLIALIGLGLGLRFGEGVLVRELASAGVVIATGVALVVSVQRRKAGVAGQRALAEKRSARVAAMTGIEREESAKDDSVAEFPPVLDAIAPIIGLVGIVAAGLSGNEAGGLLVLRLVVGAAFLGVITDAMLLGHWYLVQPGLSRAPLLELVRWTGYLWPAELIVMILPTGMISVLNGTIDDGYQGILGWYWLASAVATLALVFVTKAALRERQYSAVMAATGLTYLAILTGFSMDLVARALL
ncbi:MAG: hypothetical protein WC184_08545 [Acidimicrobiia bacterium]